MKSKWRGGKWQRELSSAVAFNAAYKLDNSPMELRKNISNYFRGQRRAPGNELLAARPDLRHYPAAPTVVRPAAALRDCLVNYACISEI